MEKLKPIATDDGIPTLLRRGPAPTVVATTTTTTTTKPAVMETSNPFDPEKLRISLDFADGIGVKKAILTIPVRKPSQQDFIRVRPDEAFRLPAALIEIKDDRETFLVAPEIARDIPGEYFTATMFTCMNRQGVLFLWPVRLPSTDGRQLEWHRSAAEAAEMAMTRWVRVKANMSLVPTMCSRRAPPFRIRSGRI